MRASVLLILAVLVAALWAFDAYEHDCHYRMAFWGEVKYQGQKIDDEVEKWLGSH